MNTKKPIKLGLLMLLFFVGQILSAQTLYEVQVLENGDTIYIAPPLRHYFCFPPMTFKNKNQEKFYWKTVRDVKKTLPYAKIVGKTLNEANAKMETLSESEKKIFLDKLEKDVKKKYTPIIKDMTFSQGKMLVKLIDRETHITSYELIKRYRGSFSAFFWQGIAKLFKGDLKLQYGGNDKDKIIERVIILVEAGQL